MAIDVSTAASEIGLALDAIALVGSAVLLVAAALFTWRQLRAVLDLASSDEPILEEYEIFEDCDHPQLEDDGEAAVCVECGRRFAIEDEDTDDEGDGFHGEHSAICSHEAVEWDETLACGVCVECGAEFDPQDVPEDRWVDELGMH